MANYFTDIQTAIAALHAAYASAANTVSPTDRGQLAKAVFTDLRPIARDISGTDGDYLISSLSGVSVSTIQSSQPSGTGDYEE